MCTILFSSLDHKQHLTETSDSDAFTADMRTQLIRKQSVLKTDP